MKGLIIMALDLNKLYFTETFAKRLAKKFTKLIQDKKMKNDLLTFLGDQVIVKSGGNYYLVYGEDDVEIKDVKEGNVKNYKFNAYKNLPELKRKIVTELMNKLKDDILASEQNRMEDEADDLIIKLEHIIFSLRKI